MVVLLPFSGGIMEQCIYVFYLFVDWYMFWDICQVANYLVVNGGSGSKLWLNGGICMSYNHNGFSKPHDNGLIVRFILR